MRIQRTTVLSDVQLIKNLHRSAQIFNMYSNKDILIIFSKSKHGPFGIYEFFVGKDNFQHLAGGKYPKGADVFFDKCLQGIVERKDIVPVDSRGVTSCKIEILPEAIDLKNGKLYKIGKKSLWTEFNRFCIAIGNANSIMGIDKRNYYLPVPVTIIRDSISKYCEETQDIFLIMTKNIDDDKYSDILFERTSDILHKVKFSAEIVKKIHSNMLI